MRKFIIPFLLMLCLSFFACKKADFRSLENNTPTVSNNLAAKVRPWLDTQKSTYKRTDTRNIIPNKDAVIDLLKEHLMFSKASTEQIDKKNTYLSIPIKDAFLYQKHLDRNATLALLLNIDSVGNINAGGLVYFQPADRIKHSSFPQNTFRNMFSGKPIEIDGLYKMLTVGGTWISQFEVKDKKLHSIGVITKKESSASLRTTMGCTEWYLETTYYFSDGSSYKVTSSLGITCSGDCSPASFFVEEGNTCDPNGSSGGGNEDYPAVADEYIYGGRSMLDPSGSGNLINTSFRAKVQATYMVKSRKIVSIAPQKPYPVQPSQYFVDANGNLAHASVTVDNQFIYKVMPLMGGLQAMVTYDFTSRWYYTYSTGTHGPLSFNEYLSELIGPF